MSTELWRTIQDHVGAKPDGNPGSETARLIAVALGLIPAPVVKPVVMPTVQFDPRTEANIATLIPAAQKLARLFMVQATLRMLEYDIEPRIISGTRTYAEQNALYAQGRTKPGKVVTNAKGGYSNHNFGIAFDIGLFRDGKYLAESPHYKTIGPVGESVGLSWGGRWTKFADTPHYELKTGMTLAEMRARLAAGKPIA